MKYIVPNDSTWADHAKRTTILRGVVGSTAHGVSVGSDDRDEMGVCLPDPKWVIGTSEPKHLVQRDQPEGVRSQPGDLDLTIYSLKRYVHLLLNKANPTCQILLWLPESMLTVQTQYGRELRALREYTISRKLGASFLGYMRHQRERLMGIRGQRNVTRPELVEQYGFDTKYAGHVIRLGQDSDVRSTAQAVDLRARDAENSCVRPGQIAPR